MPKKAAVVVTEPGHADCGGCSEIMYFTLLQTHVEPSKGPMQTTAFQFGMVTGQFAPSFFENNSTNAKALGNSLYTGLGGADLCTSNCGLITDKPKHSSLKFKAPSPESLNPRPQTPEKPCRPRGIARSPILSPELQSSSQSPSSLTPKP